MTPLQSRALQIKQELAKINEQILQITDPAMLRAREAFEKSGLSLGALGEAMGYSGDMARKSAWQFLNKTADPRLSMLRKFAAAVGVPVADLM